MSICQSQFLNTLISRGYFHQCTDIDTLDQELKQKTITAYIGFDATADSLHVGSLLPIMMLRHLQQSGHKPLIIMGGGTTKIGDPSGKDENRQLLTSEVIDYNIQQIKKIFEKFLHFGNGPTDAQIINNDDWISSLNYVDFLREYGSHFTLNRMLTFDSVKLRLEREQPLTFLEFNYMIFQAYDFLQLSRSHNCTLQMGGSDQWGNIINGIELSRRVDQKQTFGLTCPLLTTSSGAKMGKTAQGAIWLNEDKLSPYDYWQYWRNTEDNDVVRFLKLFTILPLDEIERIAKLEGSNINEGKILLANEATKLCHGEIATQKAQTTAQKVFENNEITLDLPTFTLSQSEFKKGITSYQAFVLAGLCSSNSEARRFIKSKGAKLNDALIEDDQQLLTQKNLNEDNVIKLSIGKKRHALLHIK